VDGRRPGAGYWMTPVAWARTVCGIVSPSAWAVFRLTMKWNLTGCSTGRSAGRRAVHRLDVLAVHPAEACQSRDERLTARRRHGVGREKADPPPAGRLPPGRHEPAARQQGEPGQRGAALQEMTTRKLRYAHVPHYSRGAERAT